MDEPAVRDHKLITANGLADVEFAREIWLNLMCSMKRSEIAGLDSFAVGEYQPTRNPDGSTCRTGRAAERE